MFVKLCVLNNLCVTVDDVSRVVVCSVWFIWFLHRPPNYFVWCCTVNFGYVTYAESFQRRKLYVDDDERFLDIMHPWRHRERERERVRWKNNGFEKQCRWKWCGKCWNYLRALRSSTTSTCDVIDDWWLMVDRVPLAVRPPANAYQIQIKFRQSNYTPSKMNLVI